jgi:hypothetical protein
MSIDERKQNTRGNNLKWSEKQILFDFWEKKS